MDADSCPFIASRQFQLRQIVLEREKSGLNRGHSSDFFRPRQVWPTGETTVPAEFVVHIAS